MRRFFDMECYGQDETEVKKERKDGTREDEGASGVMICVRSSWDDFPVNISL